MIGPYFLYLIDCEWIIGLHWGYASLETGRMLGTSLRPETGIRLAPEGC